MKVLNISTNFNLWYVMTNAKGLSRSSREQWRRSHLQGALCMSQFVPWLSVHACCNVWRNNSALRNFLASIDWFFWSTSFRVTFAFSFLFFRFASILHLSIHTPSKYSNTWNFVVFIGYQDEIDIRGHYFNPNKAIDESNLRTHQTPGLKFRKYEIWPIGWNQDLRTWL